MIFDGETLSLWPSIGNWDYACRSHYVIKHNRVIDAGSWSDDEITAGRQADKAAKAKFYRSEDMYENPLTPTRRLQLSPGFLSRIKAWFTKGR
jgi:hypothetical protein